MSVMGAAAAAAAAAGTAVLMVVVVLVAMGGNYMVLPGRRSAADGEGRASARARVCPRACFAREHARAHMAVRARLCAC